MRSSLILTSALAFCAVLPAQLGKFTIPMGFATTEAPASSNLPWGYGATTGSRTMYAYDASHFTKQGVNAPTTITRMRFRGDGAVTYAGGGVYGLAIITMSTMPKAISTLKTPLAFAGNHGKDVVEVYKGAVAVGKLTGTTPNDWHIDVTFQKPFVYDPKKGPLLVELACDKSQFKGPVMGNIRIDLAATAASGYNRMYELTSHTATTSTGANECGVVIEMTCGICADVDGVTATAGGTQNLKIVGTSANAGKSYWLLGSVTGTSPGVSLLGIHIPLNVDPYTDFTIANANSSVLKNSRGTLDKDGNATASFVVPANAAPMGLKFYHAALVFDAKGWHMGTCAASCTIK